MVGFLLGRVQTYHRVEGRPDPIASVVQSTILPPADGLQSMMSGVNRFFGGFGQTPALQKENEALRQKIAEFKNFETREKSLQQEIDALRKLSKLPPEPVKTRIPARVIQFSPHEARMTLNVGTEKGLKPGMAVLQGDGLLGVISTVSNGESQLNLITSTQVRVGGMIVKEEVAAGLVRGQGPDSLVLEFIEGTVKVDVGDIVVTSGYSKQIPRGIPIGQVESFEKEISYGNRRARLVPMARVGSALEVYVLR